MKVEIVGPNLHPSVSQGEDFHVHAAGCSDLNRYAGMRDQRGEFGLWWLLCSGANIDKEIVEEIYSDFLPTGDDGEPNTWEDFADTVRIFPCVYKEAQS